MKERAEAEANKLIGSFLTSLDEQLKGDEETKTQAKFDTAVEGVAEESSSKEKERKKRTRRGTRGRGKKKVQVNKAEGDEAENVVQAEAEAEDVESKPGAAEPENSTSAVESTSIEKEKKRRKRGTRGRGKKKLLAKKAGDEAKTETQAKVEAESEAKAVAEVEVEVEAETEAVDAEAEVEKEAETEAEAEVKVEAVAEAEAIDQVEFDAEAETDALESKPGDADTENSTSAEESTSSKTEKKKRTREGHEPEEKRKYSGYAPQVGCELEEKERFWSELDEVMESIPTGERVVIGADFNGHVGEGNTGDEEVMGKFGVKERNFEGQMVVDFAKRMDMGVVNTYFQKREEHRVTYKSGGRRTQVDYILCRRGNLKEISDCKVVVGESVARQHRMVVCRMTLMVCKTKRSKIEIEKKTKWWKLKKEECCEEFRQKLRQALGGQVVLPDDWETTAEVIRETGRKVLGVSSGRRKEDKETWWWNEEVQDSIQRKRLAKKKWDMDRTEENRQEYRELQRRVKREVSKAKQKAYDELYTRLDTREGEKDLYRLARQRDGDGKDVQQVRVIKDRDGRVLTSEESVQRRWKKYFEELMNEENEREKRVEGVNSVEQKVDKIRKDEVRKALKRMKSGKAVGPDDIPVEVWKCLGEAAVEFLASLFNRVLESERMPEEWRRSVLVPIFKNKGDMQSCSNYRGIKLMSHTMKLWERVVEARLRKVVEICEQQYGFMPRKSTTDAIFALRILMEKYRDGQRELHCVFVDLEKAYDRVPREELWYCMRKSGVAGKYVRVVQDMYERSRTVVRCAVGQTEEFNVEVGLHQGSALSPFLFAIVMDQLSEEVRQESPWTMMFADDIVICSESREQVEENLERWRFALERRGMKVSRSKTEYMCVNEREGSGTVRLQGEEVKKVEEFKYLGSTVQSNGECGKEVKKRVQAGWNGWRKVSGVLCDQKISARIKGKVYRTVVRPAMLYGLETVSLRKRQESELEVAELKMLRFSLGVTRLDRIRNEYIRGTAHVGRLGDKVREARLRWFGHVQRRDKLGIWNCKHGTWNSELGTLNSEHGTWNSKLLMGDDLGIPVGALQIQCYQCEEIRQDDCSSPEFIINCTVNVQDMCQKEVLIMGDDHISIELTQSYRPLICRTQPSFKTVQVWSEESTSQLQDCFENWELFTQSADLEEYRSSILAYIAFCTDTVLTTKTIKVFPNQKPWLDRKVCSLLKALVPTCLKSTTIVPVPKKQQDAASLPSVEDVPSQTFFFFLVFAFTPRRRRRSPATPPSLPPLGGFRPSRAEVVTRLYYMSGDVARLCCSAVGVARLCCSAVDIVRLCCSAVDVAQPSCSAVDVTRRFCLAVDIVWDPLALPPCPSFPPLASPCSSLPPLASPCSSLPSPASPCSSLPPLASPCSSLPPPVASPCSLLLSGFSWTKNSSGLWVLREDSFEMHSVDLELEAVEKQICDLQVKQAQLRQRKAALESSRTDAHLSQAQRKDAACPGFVHSGAGVPRSLYAAAAEDASQAPGEDLSPSATTRLRDLDPEPLRSPSRDHHLLVYTLPVEHIRHVSPRYRLGCELEEKERFWSELDEVMESIPTGERVVIGADFNGHVGEGNRGDGCG
ncbi:hypothetical protein QTP86_000764 [Hemibagrus guttatus]|nr:hypothetical protein QTP86_000764 [Hemibagrus guttatus]